MKHRVGIEALAVAAPRRYLAIEDLAVARGVAPEKYTVGLGAREMAVAGPGEDTVALAATAAARLLRMPGVDAASIGMLVVGTETGVDHSKPVASFVQGLVGLPRTMRKFDTQHACYGGTAALMAACDWIASGNADGRTALVICSDIARCGVNSAGEPAQGGAAVARRVSDRPEVLALDHGLSGVSSTDVHDFWRPLGRREALVDGHYSIECYLDAVAGAYRAWRQRATERELLRDGPTYRSEQLARIVYHVPFCKMARKAHAHIRRCELADMGGIAFDAAALAREASPASNPRLRRRSCSRVGSATPIRARSTSALPAFSTRRAPSSRASVSGSSRTAAAAPRSSSRASSGRAPRPSSRPRRLDELLAARTRIDVAEYERIMAMPRETDDATDAAPGTFRFAGVRDDRRTYVLRA